VGYTIFKAHYRVRKEKNEARTFGNV
jgi:hypothetical protein